MNYQPFFEMNILLSDSLIQSLTENKIPFAFIIIATFFSVYLVSVMIHEFIKSSRIPKRSYMDELQ